MNARTLAFAAVALAGCTDTNPFAVDALEKRFSDEAAARVTEDRATLSSCAVWVQGSLDATTKGLASEAAQREQGDKDAVANAQTLIAQAKQDMANQLAAMKASIIETHLIAPDAVTDLGRYVAGSVSVHPKFGMVEWGIQYMVRFTEANCTGAGYMDWSGSTVPIGGVRRIGPNGVIWDQSGSWHQIQVQSDLSTYQGKTTCTTYAMRDIRPATVTSMLPSSDTATPFTLGEMTLRNVPR